MMKKMLAAVGALAVIGCGPPQPEVDFSGPTADWPEYRAAAGGGGYSPLTQITPTNVSALQVAWTYNTGFVAPSGTWSSFQTTPLVVGNTLYFCTPDDRVVALDPETGAEHWVFDPEVDESRVVNYTSRGERHWRDPDAASDAACASRLFLGTVDARLIALDARTGALCAEFGDGGIVDLTEGLGEIRRGEYAVTSPAAIVDGRLVTGALVYDNLRRDAPSGVVRAFDVRSGALAWSWSAVPPGAEPVEVDAEGQRVYRRGTANAWTAFSADRERGLVFVPTGNTAPDHWGGDRDGLDHYSSSVVALRAATGQVAWHFRTVHHDLWDYDVGAQPVLFDFTGSDGQTRPALAAGTKAGHVYLLDRETGEPLFPVEERAVPQEGAPPGEYLSPTQPFPTAPPPLHPERLDPEDAFGFTFYDRGRCRDVIESLDSDGIYTPPSLRGSVLYPGMVGGINWGSLALDQSRERLVVNTQRIATILRLVPRAEFEAIVARGEKSMFMEAQQGTPYAILREPLLSPFGAPCNPPPWGTLVAIDTRRGQVVWEVTLGTVEGMAPWPLHHFFEGLGTPNLGGPITTASGLTFIAATTDPYLRAFSTETGEELWRGRLPATGQASPATYRLGPDRRQFVVIAAGGHAGRGTPLSDALVAFALP